jgi:hypothetical protein
MTTEYKFWLVKNTSGGAAQKMHGTIEEAREEAKRLAAQNNGHTFVVAEAVEAYRQKPVEIERFPVKHRPEEAPAS